MFFKIFKESAGARENGPAHRALPDSSILDELPDGYYRVDLKGNFIYANTALYKLHGGRAESVLGVNFRRFTTTRSARKAIEICYGVYCTGTPSKIIDFEMLDDHRQHRYLEVSVGLLRNHDGKPAGFHGVVRDRTGEKGTSSDLDRYRNFVESLDDGCFEVDLDGTITFINDAMCKIHGYPPQELLGMNHRSFASREDARNIYATFNQVFNSGAPSKIIDYAIIHRDGSPRYLEVSATLIGDDKGNAIGFRGITRDRTEKRMKELELERYRDFIESVDDACYEVDLSGNMTFFNNATANNFGYSTEQLMGLSNQVYSTPETAKKIYAIYNQIYKTGTPAKIKGYEIIGADGQKRYLDLTASLIRDPKGTPIGFRGIGRDITDQHNVARDNERLSEMVNQIQRLEAVSALAAGVAHNFNNLLMSIQGYVSLIEMDIGAGAPNFDRFKVIQEKIHKGSQLTAQLLNYANIEKQSVTFGDINKIAREVTALFKTDSNRVRLVTALAADLPPVAVDRHQMAHVLTNLLTNADQAMPDGGTIELKTERTTLTEAFTRPHGREPGPYLLITVSDTGEGMDPEVQKRIFEPFFTTKEVGLGSGLGLASVYGIVKSHSGIIEVHSRPGQGATFTIYLPITSPPPKDRKAPPRSVADANAPRTILLVDDERITLELMHKWLEKMGHRVITAQTGEEALEIYVTQREKIDLVIMDVVMPGISGNEALARMGAIDPDVKAILVSGFIDSSQEEGIIRNGRQALFQKPVDYNTFSDAINRLLAIK